MPKEPSQKEKEREEKQKQFDRVHKNMRKQWGFEKSEIESKPLLKRERAEKTILDLKERGIIDKNLFTSQRIPRCIHLLMKLTPDTDNLEEVSKVLYDLYSTRYFLERIERKLYNFPLKFPKKLDFLN